MSDFEPIDDAVENVTTLSNCWLKLLHDFDCSTTQIRVEEVIQEILEALDGSDSVDEVQYHNRMHEASLLLRDWLKFEQQVKPMIDAGFSNTRLSVKVADLKNPAKKYRFYTPMRFSPADHELKSKGIVFKIPFGHLMARCAKLETSPVDQTAVAAGEIELDKDGKVARFEHPVDLRRYILRGKEKFKKAFIAYMRAAFEQTGP